MTVPRQSIRIHSALPLLGGRRRTWQCGGTSPIGRPPRESLHQACRLARAAPPCRARPANARQHWAFENGWGGPFVPGPPEVGVGGAPKAASGEALGGRVRQPDAREGLDHRRIVLAAMPGG